MKTDLGDVLSIADENNFSANDQYLATQNLLTSNFASDEEQTTELEECYDHTQSNTIILNANYPNSKCVTQLSSSTEQGSTQKLSDQLMNHVNDINQNKQQEIVGNSQLNEDDLNEVDTKMDMNENEDGEDEFTDDIPNEFFEKLAKIPCSQLSNQKSKDNKSVFNRIQPDNKVLNQSESNNADQLNYQNDKTQEITSHPASKSNSIIIQDQNLDSVKKLISNKQIPPRNETEKPNGQNLSTSGKFFEDELDLSIGSKTFAKSVNFLKTVQTNLNKEVTDLHIPMDTFETNLSSNDFFSDPFISESIILKNNEATCEMLQIDEESGNQDEEEEDGFCFKTSLSSQIPF